MARKKKAAAGAVKVNFKGVESRQTPPEGDYIVEVLEATLDQPKGKQERIEFVLEIAEGKYKGCKLWLYCTLDEKSLWKLHAFLTALGVEVPEDEMDIDLSDLIGEKCVGVVTHETYNGKKRAKMTDFDSLENYSGDRDSDDDDDDEDEDDKKKSKKSKSKKDAGKKSKKSKKDDDDEDEDEDDEDEDEKPSKKSKSKKSKKPADDEDEDEDEDEKPAKGKKSKKADKGKKKPKKLDRDDIEDMDEDELQELIDEHDLDVDLDDFKKLPKKVAAVIAALEEEDLLEEEDDD